MASTDTDLMFQFCIYPPNVLKTGNSQNSIGISVTTEEIMAIREEIMPLCR